MKQSIQSFSLLVAGALAVIFCGCSDPADKVAKATTSAANNSPAAPATAASRTFIVQPDSKIEFTGSKVTGSHNGGFKTFEGKLDVAQRKLVGSPQVKIDMNSTWTDTEKLTGHLKSPDFFNVAKFPSSTFTVTSVEGEGTAAKITGTLELHGVTKTISFPAKLEVTDETVHLTAEFALNRKDFNISYPGKPDDLIRDNVVIRFDLKAAPSKG